MFFRKWRRSSTIICSLCGCEIAGNVYHRISGDILCEECLCKEYSEKFGDFDRDNLRETVLEDPLVALYESADDFDRDRCEDIEESIWRDNHESDLL